MKSFLRGWAMYTFYNTLDLNAIKSWIILKEVIEETKTSREVKIYEKFMKL